MKRFSILGAGNLGTYLAHALVNSGFQLTGIYKQSKYNQFPQCVIHDAAAMVHRSDFIVIAAQESKIEAAAHLLAEQSNPKGKVFFHTCNGMTSAQLSSLKAKGAYTASFSPLQTFPAFPVQNVQHIDIAGVFRNVCFLTEGDSKAIDTAREITAALNAIVRQVESDKKIFYHIAGVAASNFLISILKLAERQLTHAAMPEEPVTINDLLPLVRQTLDNVEKRGVEASLTGPFKRGEMEIIARHLDMMDNPDDIALYNALTRYLSL